MATKYLQEQAFGFSAMVTQTKVKNQPMVPGFSWMSYFRYVIIWFLKQDRHFFIVLCKIHNIEKNDKL